MPVNENAAPGRVGDVRRRNLSLVLDSIARTGDAKPSRAQLAAATGLTKAAVSSLVAELVESGLVSEVGLYRDGERGRPGQGLELSPRRGVVGMEINVDYLAVGLVDLGETSASPPLWSRITVVLNPARSWPSSQNLPARRRAPRLPGT